MWKDALFVLLMELLGNHMFPTDSSNCFLRNRSAGQLKIFIVHLTPLNLS